MISSDIRCEKLETPARDRHEFWDGGQILIGVGDFGVANVGRERCHPIVDIGAMFVPKLNAAANKGVAQVMDAHFTKAAPRGPTEFGTKLLENLIDPSLRDETALRREEQRRILGESAVTRTNLEIVPQRGYDGWHA